MTVVLLPGADKTATETRLRSACSQKGNGQLQTWIGLRGLNSRSDYRKGCQLYCKSGTLASLRGLSAADAISQN
jgi:hypothetical protein